MRLPPIPILVGYSDVGRKKAIAGDLESGLGDRSVIYHCRHYSGTGGEPEDVPSCADLALADAWSAGACLRHPLLPALPDSA